MMTLHTTQVITDPTSQQLSGREHFKSELRSYSNGVKDGILAKVVGITTCNQNPSHEFSSHCNQQQSAS